MKTGKIKNSVSDKQFHCGYFATMFQLSLCIFILQNFPEVKIGAIVAEIKDVKGQLKSLISGKEQTFELEPGESVSFIINDDPNFYENNNGEAIINYSVISSCGK